MRETETQFGLQGFVGNPEVNCSATPREGREKDECEVSANDCFDPRDQDLQAVNTPSIDHAVNMTPVG
jgi:hypothetical protein